ncbi:MAG TPA: hypothetical protein PKA78_02390 [Macellibacteroides fermentans]|uniref:hypothetical protein n=1 Tax=Macellibacteroides fermentans TaxID=879969 RepID=UPI002CDB2842|nr:hypothetical protein [Macellibacteroides fermentans]
MAKDKRNGECDYSPMSKSRGTHKIKSITHGYDSNTGNIIVIETKDNYLITLHKSLVEVKYMNNKYFKLYERFPFYDIVTRIGYVNYFRLN